MRTEIRKVLEQKSVATAKHVAHAAGLELKDVLAELNKMHADGEVEREKRNGNEYSYWLTASAPASDATATVASNQNSLQDEMKDVIAEVATESAAATPAACRDCQGSGKVRKIYSSDLQACHCAAGEKFRPDQIASETTAAAEQVTEATGAELDPVPVIPQPIIFVTVEAAIQFLAEQLPQGVSLGIFSDGSIDLTDGESGNTYLPTPETLRDCLDCFHKLQAYKQAA